MKEYVIDAKNMDEKELNRTIKEQAKCHDKLIIDNPESKHNICAGLSEDVDISKLIENEKKRRNNLMNELYKITSFNSENYGKIVFNSGNTFTWDNFSLLVPSLISSSAKNRGTVNITYLMDKKFENNYNGVLTFKFEGMEDKISFLYKLDSDGLRIESLDSYSIKDNIVVGFVIMGRVRSAKSPHTMKCTPNTDSETINKLEENMISDVVNIQNILVDTLLISENRYSPIQFTVKQKQL